MYAKYKCVECGMILHSDHKYTCGVCDRIICKFCRRKYMIDNHTVEELMDAWLELDNE